MKNDNLNSKQKINDIKVQTAHAILLVSGNYALQLRDNKPTIAAPGEWSLFGGIMEKEETPLQAIKREIFEELSIEPVECKQLWFTDYYCNFNNSLTRTWFFMGNVTSNWSQHKLKEGQRLGVFKFAQLSQLSMPSVMRDSLERFHYQNKHKNIKFLVLF